MAASLGQFSPIAWANTKKSDLQAILKESESLILSQEREKACVLLNRVLRTPGLSAEDEKKIRERLKRFSRQFITEKGFQLYLAGKGLLEEQKPSEAVGRFKESAELEMLNQAVNEGIARAYLRLKNFPSAFKASNDGLALYGQDIPLLQTRLQAQSGMESWEEALPTSSALLNLEDRSIHTLKERAVALIKSSRDTEAESLLQEVISKDKNFPESYYWLATLKEKAEAKTEAKALLEKYRVRCRSLNLEDPSKAIVAKKKYERENDLCGKLK